MKQPKEVITQVKEMVQMAEEVKCLRQTVIGRRSVAIAAKQTMCLQTRLAEEALKKLIAMEDELISMGYEFPVRPSEEIRGMTFDEAQVAEHYLDQSLDGEFQQAMN